MSPDQQSSGPAHRGEARVVIAQAQVGYRGRPVLRGASVTLHGGEIYGLLGPNGAGKSTLMKTINGQRDVEAGSVRIFSPAPATGPQVRRAVAFVPQDIAIFQHMTVRENLEVFGRLAGLKGTALRRAVADTLMVANLEDRANQICRELSGGYQRRTNICCSILTRPPILLLDEPTVGIDIDAREGVHGLLRELRAAGTAIMLTTHDLDQAQALCDRIGIMLDGRIALEGAPQELIARQFGSNRELQVLMRAEPPAHLHGALRAMGLRATQSPSTWWGVVHPAYANATAIQGHLAAAGIAATEIRVRAPDLSTLFHDCLTRAEGGR
jgi:ABC-2 type transport system ATP-binding protein